MSKPCDVSLIILSYNTRDLLRRCLESARAGSGGFESELIVVDNASSDGSAGMVRAEFPGVRVIETGSNLGYAGGNNVGIRRSRGEFILLLNSDAFLCNGALSGMVELLRGNPRAGIVGPRLAHEDGSLHLSCRHFPNLLRQLVRVTAVHRLCPFRWAREWDWMCEFRHDVVRRVDMLSGACWMLRRTMLDQIGLLSEALFVYGEEYDLCRRALRAGWETWFVPAGPVVHLGGRSSLADATGSVVTSFHRYRSDYLTARWHRGRLAALLTAGLDQAVLRWRLFKSGLVHPDHSAMHKALRTAIDNASRAARETARWHDTPCRQS